MKKSMKLAMLAVAIAFTGFGLFSCTTPVTPIDTAKLDGYWILKTMKGEDARTLFGGSLPGVEFNFQDSTIYGSGGCNRISGKFTLNNKNELKVPMLISTLMACENMNQEGTFTSLLSPSTLTLSFDQNGLLVASDSLKNIVLLFQKGELPKPGPTTSEIVNPENVTGKWSLKSFANEDIAKLFTTKSPYIEFATDGKVSGNAGCNNFSGGYSVAEGKVVFTPLTTTRMACPSLDGENKLLSILKDSVEGSINDGVLTFYKDQAMVLEFVKDADTVK